MSKGSNFWGTARGKLGNMVISSVKGQQVERKYQPQVSNPKTFAQMRQRAVFSSAVKFFKHSRQNLFKFAFEDKVQKESDYNAFMRHNVKCFTAVNKIACDNPTLPALGFNLNLLLSMGSLPSADDATNFFSDINDTGLCLNVDPVPKDPTQADKTTWGQVSQVIIKQFGLSDGDILTSVVVNTHMSLAQFSSKLIAGEDASTPSTPATWTIEQKQLNTLSTEDVTDQMPENTKLLFKNGFNEKTSEVLYFGSIIFSRNIKGRSLMVSTSSFSCSIASYESKLLSEGSAEEKNVLLTWGANQEAILKGALL